MESTLIGLSDALAGKDEGYIRGFGIQKTLISRQKQWTESKDEIVEIFKILYLIQNHI